MFGTSMSLTQWHRHFVKALKYSFRQNKNITPRLCQTRRCSKHIDYILNQIHFWNFSHSPKISDGSKLFKIRDCPNDIKEAISSLIFASARCGDIPELFVIRILFGKRYGEKFATTAVELFPGNHVNKQVHFVPFGKGLCSTDNFDPKCVLYPTLTQFWLIWLYSITFTFLNYYKCRFPCLRLCFLGKVNRHLLIMYAYSSNLKFTVNGELVREICAWGFEVQNGGWNS